MMILCRSADPPGDPPLASHPDVVPVGALLQEEMHRGREIWRLTKILLADSRNFLFPFPEHSPFHGAGLAAHGGVREEDIDRLSGQPAPFLLPLRPEAHRTDHQRPLQPPAELRPRSRVRVQRQQRRVHRQRLQQPLRPHQELLQVLMFVY